MRGMSLTLRLIFVPQRDIDFELTLLRADINHLGTISKQIATQSESGLDQRAECQELPRA